MSQAIYIALFHRNALRVLPLYSDRGSIVGGVVEYPNRIHVYMI